MAAYSLQITQLNARWLAKKFSNVEGFNSAAISTGISALQHIPTRLSPNPALLPSLIVLPQNGVYWGTLLRSARKIRRWSIPIIVNFIWVLLSGLLTTIDTFSTPVPGEIGYAIVTTLAYLLPLTIGWLHVGSEPETNHLKESLEEANKIARVSVGKGEEPVLATRLTEQPNRAIEIVKEEDVDFARRDELKTNPVYNYSRVFAWSQTAETIYRLTRNAAVKAEMGFRVGSEPPTVNGLGANVETEGQNWGVHEVIRYCGVEYIQPEKTSGTPYPAVLSSPGPSTSHSPAADLPLPFYTNHTEIQESALWAEGVGKRVALAACLSLGLQWGTTGAGLLIYYEMHPVGLGCRTTSLLIYGVLGTLSFLLLLASSVLAHLSRPPPGWRYRHSRLRSFQETGAILCRWLGKVLALIAGLGILVISLIQPLGMFDNCWCSTRTFDRPAQAVAFMTGNFISQWGVFKYWVGGLAMAFATTSIFGLSIYFGTPRVR